MTPQDNGTVLFTGSLSTEMINHFWRLTPLPHKEEFYNFLTNANKDMPTFIADVMKNGIREPITLSRDGFILDGKHRFCIAILLRIERLKVVYEDKLSVWELPQNLDGAIKKHGVKE